jgi:hypothetical protein
MEKKKKRRTSVKKKTEQLFLIDFDLPQKSKCRRKFYKKKKDLNLGNSNSTRSVILTKDKKKAIAIHKKAKKCGVANFYMVKKIN